MATKQLISVEEYLTTSYRPDVDYVDGDIVERNVGEKDHSRIQTLLVGFFLPLRKKLGLHVFTELRVQVRSDRFRIPDICATIGDPPEQVLTKPPLIVVEVLSPRDSLSGLSSRLDDYLTMGVPYVWVVDPHRHEAYAYSRDGFRRVDVLEVEDPHVVLPLSELFADLD